MLHVPKYQQYVNYQKTKYRLVHLVFNAEKYYTGTYYTRRTLRFRILCLRFRIFHSEYVSSCRIFMMMMRLRIGYFVNNWAVKNGQRFLLAPILQMLFDQLRNILQRLKLFTGTQRQIFSRPPYFLVWITYHIGTTVIISFEGSADAAYASGATDFYRSSRDFSFYFEICQRSINQHLTSETIGKQLRDRINSGPA